MKLKNWLIISVVIQIVLAIYSMCMPNKVVELQNSLLTEEYMELGASADDVVITSAINVVLSTVIGIIALTNNVVKRKGTLIMLYIAIFIITTGEITSWIAVINIIALATIKREKTKFNSKQAVTLLKIEQNKLTKKEIILMVLLAIIYFMQLVPPPNWILIQSLIVRVIFVVLIYVVLFVLAVMAFWKEIKQGLKIIKQNFKIYMKYLIRVFAVAYIFYLLSIFAANMVIEDMTFVNQQTLETIPIYLLAPLAIIWAAVVEECVFRGVLRKIIKNDVIYILTSAILFGLIHVVNEATIGVAIATAVPYMVLGGAFAYTYAKTNNLAGNILFHGMYNGIGVLLQLFV